MAQKERIPELDIFRAIAILAVLAIHATSRTLTESLDTSLFHPFLYINKFSQFAVPTFVFLSGFVLFYNYIDKPLTGKTLGKFYLKRLTYIVIPYLIFSVLYLVLKLWAAHQWNLPPAEIAAKLWKYVYTGTAYTHLYYVIIIIQFYVLFPLFLWCLQKIHTLAMLSPLIGLGLQWGFIVLNKHMTLQGHWNLSKGSLAITYFSYFLLGAALAVYFPKLKQWLAPSLEGWKSGKGAVWIPVWLLWLGAGIVHVELWYNYYARKISVNSLWYEAAANAHALLSCIVLFQLSYLLYRPVRGRLSAMLVSIGACSFGIYLIHPAFLHVYRSWAPQGGTPAVYAALIAGGMAVALLGSWLIVAAAFRFLPGAWVLFGSVPKRPAAIRQPESSGRSFS